MRVLETRTTPEGWKRRRYDADGRRFSTIEIPAEVARAVGIGKLRDLTAAHKRGMAKHDRAAALRLAVALRAGWKATAVAHELGITEARVRQIRAGK